jgi:hypothetical protein
MANLSRSQLAGLAQSVGFTGNDVDIAVAVALAESGGNPGDYNGDRSTEDDSYGLWQINMYKELGPDRRKKFGISSNTELFRPAVNAKAAKIVHAESGWKAWTTYTDGTYKEFLTKDPVLPTGPIENTPGKVGTPAEVEQSTEPTSLYESVTSGFNALGSNLFKGTANLVGVTVAIALLVLGVVLLARNVIPYGKVLKVGKRVLK